jgi:mRNA-decapping enzyme subunit 2
MASTENNPEWDEALEDVHTRFILNLPPSELETADRIFFQLEQAWWFYEDFICDPQPTKKLPRFKDMRPFALKLFGYSPLLPDQKQFKDMWTEFSKYKRKISNYGCILLNQECNKVVLCQVWNGKSFTFPSGKINQGESAVEAAARETYEETGFDPNCLFGKTLEMKDASANIPWQVPLRESDALVYQENDGKRRTCYVCRGVPEDFPFAPVARKEVSKIAWYPLDKIPKPNYAVQPFLPQLHKWIKKRQAKTTPNNVRQTPNRSRGRRTPNRSRQNSRQKVRGNDSDLVQTGLAVEGDVSGWSEEDMFATNERLLGRKVEYDGNPHSFVEKGFGQQDPHAFHVVGESFMNSAVQSLAPPPQVSKLQPLFRPTTGENDELQPFFADDGVTPWGDDRVGKQDAAMATTTPSSTLTTPVVPQTIPPGATPTTSSTTDSLFLTDAEITARSQAIKTVPTRQARQSQADRAYVRAWLDRLPKPPITKHFGEFKLDADAIVEEALRQFLKV